MKIGEALKEERLRLGLSIRKMTQGIIDPTFYSRVERENRNIGAEALVKILFVHEINIEEFFEKIKDTYAPSEIIEKVALEDNICLAFNNHDVVKMRQYMQAVNQLDDEVLKLRVIVGIAYLENKIEHLSPEIVNRIYSKLDENDELSRNINAIRLFTNVMPVLSDEQLNYLMNMLLTGASRIKDKTEKYDERIAITCNNYLYSCWQRKIESPVIDKAYLFMMNLKEPHLLIYKLLGSLGKNLIEGNKEQVVFIKQEIDAYGYEKFIRNWKV